MESANADISTFGRCLAVAGAFGQHFGPKHLGPGVIAALGGQAIRGPAGRPVKER
jgi:hypothetical protein